MARGTADGLASVSAVQGLQPLPALNSVRATSPSFIHQSYLKLILVLLTDTSGGLLGPGFFIPEQSHCSSTVTLSEEVFRATHITPVPILGVEKEWQ